MSFPLSCQRMSQSMEITFWQAEIGLEVTVSKSLTSPHATSQTRIGQSHIRTDKVSQC